MVFASPESSLRPPSSVTVKLTVLIPVPSTVSSYEHLQVKSETPVHSEIVPPLQTG